jgi:hypothetical protein
MLFALLLRCVQPMPIIINELIWQPSVIWKEAFKNNIGSVNIAYTVLDVGRQVFLAHSLYFKVGLYSLVLHCFQTSLRGFMGFEAAQHSLYARDVEKNAIAGFCFMVDSCMKRSSGGLGQGQGQGRQHQLMRWADNESARKIIIKAYSTFVVTIRNDGNFSRQR